MPKSDVNIDDIDLDDFVATWERSPNIKVVADHFRLSENRTKKLGEVLRKKGVKLKKMSRRGPYDINIPVQRLNSVIDQVAKEEQDD